SRGSLGNLSEILLDERDRHAPAPDARSHALDRAVPNLSRREDSWHTRLQKKGIAIERPGASCSVAEQILRVTSRADVAPPVANDLLRQPRRLRLRSDEHEQRIAVTP